MPILKQFQEQSVSIPNTTAQHKELSMSALGTLVRMSSYSNDFRFKVEWLQRDLRMGREKIQGILKELRLHGFLKTEAHHSDGKLDGQVWWVSTKPDFINTSEDSRETGFQSDENSVPLNFSTSEKPLDNKKEEKSKKDEKKKKTRAPRTPATFEEITAKVSADPKYAHINIPVEIAKVIDWLGKHPDRQFGDRFFRNWLDKVDPPVAIPTTFVMPSTTVPLAVTFGTHHPLPPENRVDIQAMEDEFFAQRAGGVTHV